MAETPLGRSCVYAVSDVLHGECAVCALDAMCSFDGLVEYAKMSIALPDTIHVDLPVMVAEHNERTGQAITEAQVRAMAENRLAASFVVLPWPTTPEQMSVLGMRDRRQGSGGRKHRNHRSTQIGGRHDGAGQGEDDQVSAVC